MEASNVFRAVQKKFLNCLKPTGKSINIVLHGTLAIGHLQLDTNNHLLCIEKKI